ncbi:MAG: DNA-formamidopyrimidine glycosylase [Brockia lithotrophica]|nr:DNA-formamidopyrimidine glycosylase [Brockia lithotrophica]MBT9253701.1 DNA-formamidopyrimidine glycosylase [Brockia lithotrophica]
MPELPEVETIRQVLDERFRGARLVGLEVRCHRLLRRPDGRESFASALVGRTLVGVGRRGKYLLFRWAGEAPEDELVLVSHLRMEGRYREATNQDLWGKHTHLALFFADGRVLAYDDVRKFGTFDLLRADELSSFPPLRKLGPEPLAPDFTPRVLGERLAHVGRRPLKSALLSQDVVSGLGNIYADEALFRARLHPLRTAGSLTPEEVVRLWTAIREVLADGLASGGASVRSYHALEEAGKFQLQLSVYGREGFPCPVCGTPIRKLRVGGRGTHVCPVCQPPSSPSEVAPGTPERG